MTGSAKYVRGLLCLISLLLVGFSGYGQEKRDYVWVFGDDNNPGIPGGEGIIMDFNNTPVEAEFLDKPMEMLFTNSSICDQEGNLLFYTNGCWIANAEHEMMLNGDSINYPGQIFESNCPESYTLPQGSLIIPMPGNDHIYYLFHHKWRVLSDPLDIVVEGLYYTIVDIYLDNGLGGVIIKNEPLLQQHLEPGQLTAIKNLNGEEWWIPVFRRQSDTVDIFQLTEKGLELSKFQSIGIASSVGGEASGQSTFSPDGKKYVRYTPEDDIFLYDFNNETGSFESFQQIAIQDSAHVGGCAISSNSRFLYISSVQDLYQFDLEADDIAASRVHIAHWDGFASPFPAVFYLSQLAPDCKIYIGSSGNVDVLHVINNPNEKGLACNFEQYSFPLPIVNSFTIPLFPNYRLGVDPPCEDMTTSVGEQAETPTVKLHPNPTSDRFMITTEPEIDQVLIRDLYGRVVSRHSISALNTIIDRDLPAGHYLVQGLDDNREVVFTERLVVVD